MELKESLDDYVTRFGNVLKKEDFSLRDILEIAQLVGEINKFGTNNGKEAMMKASKIGGRLAEIGTSRASRNTSEDLLIEYSFYRLAADFYERLAEVYSEEHDEYKSFILGDYCFWNLVASHAHIKYVRQQAKEFSPEMPNPV